MEPKFVIFLFALAFATADDAVRIVGGREAKPGQFPYMASLRIRGRHICGGAIIDANHILTAAHCIATAINNDINNVTVVTATNSRTQGGNTHRVAAMYSDPGYPRDDDKDIGIIKLASRIDFNDLQYPISMSDSRPPEREYAMISGWGSVTAPPIQVPERLQYQSVRILKFSICRIVYNDITTAICTLNGFNVGVCSGDSGSPLVYNNRVVAVAVRAVPCAKGFPDIYTSTADNMKFLREAMTW